MTNFLNERTTSTGFVVEVPAVAVPAGPSDLESTTSVYSVTLFAVYSFLWKGDCLEVSYSKGVSAIVCEQ